MRWLASSISRTGGFPAAVGGVLAAGSAAVLLTQRFPLNLLLVLAVPAGIAVLLIPALAPILLVASVPIQDVGAIGVGGFGLTATKLALATVVGIAAIHVLTRRDEIRWSIILLPYIGYLLALGLSLTHAMDLRAGLADTFRWCVALIGFLAVLYGVRSRRAVLWLTAAVGLGTVFETLLGLAQSTLGLGPASFETSAGLFRAFGTFGTPNTFAAYLEMTGPWLAALAVWGLGRNIHLIRRYRDERTFGLESSQTLRQQLFWNWAVSAWFSIAALAALAGIALSLSRGAWLGTTAAAITMIMVAGRRGFMAGILAVSIGSIFLLSGGMNHAPAPIHDRYEQLVSQMRLFDSRGLPVTAENYASIERMAHWQTGLAMFESNPVTGIGVGNFNARYNDFYANPRFPQSRGHAHNYYIHAAAETGVIGLAAYLALMGAAAMTCIRAARLAPSPLGRSLGIGGVGVMAAVMVHNVVENLHVLNLGIQLSAVWAMAVVGLRHLPPESTGRSLEREAVTAT